MRDYSSGKIFLAGERGCTENSWFRSYNTFNFGSYQNHHKTPVWPLYVLNDDTLAGGKCLSLTVEEHTDVLMLPIVGAITYKDDVGHESLIEAGQVQLSAIPKGSNIQVSNPYEKELVNFIQLWFKQPNPEVHEPLISRFDIDRHKNELIEVLPVLTNANKSLIKHPRVSIGKFWGRQEIVYTKVWQDSNVFVFVLEGAFEVQYRLLEAKDGLALNGVKEIEIEALSNDAILLVIEMPSP